MVVPIDEVKWIFENEFLKNPAKFLGFDNYQ